MHRCRTVKPAKHTRGNAPPLETGETIAAQPFQFTGSLTKRDTRTSHTVTAGGFGICAAKCEVAGVADEWENSWDEPVDD
jgi:hypothetical protein